MTFVHYDDDFPVRAVRDIVVAVLYNLDFEIFQDQKHLRVGNLSVLVCEQFLEVKAHEVLVRLKVRIAVPKVGVSTSRFKFSNVVFDNLQASPVVVVARLFDFFLDKCGKVVKSLIIRRSEHRKVAHRRDTLILVNLNR